MFRLFLVVLWISSIFASAANAQTPRNAMDIGSQITFNIGDIKAAMTPQERRRFDELNREFKELQRGGRVAPNTSVKRAIQKELERVKLARDKEFNVYRGINNQSVMVYGRPLASKPEIVAIIIGARRRGGDGMLHPHWDRTLGGQIVGSANPPGGKADGYPAGPAVGGRISIGVSPVSPYRRSDSIKCGSVPRGLKNPTCICGHSNNDVYGVMAAAGYKDCRWSSGN